MARANSFVSKKTARSILSALLAPEDVRRLEFLRAVLLCGFPGSGKSTVGYLLSTIYGFERFSTDQIRMKELYPGQKHRQASEHEQVMTARHLVYEELARRVGKAVQAGKRVVVDGTNLDEKRLMILGAILSAASAEQVAFIVFKTPEWIMRQRFLQKSEEEMRKWWSVYKYWRGYMKKGNASFPTESMFPRIRLMQVRRYALKTFDWVPDIKLILWDVDGTFYRFTSRLENPVDKLFIQAFTKAFGKTPRDSKREFWQRYKDLGSKTRVLNSVGLDGKAEVARMSVKIPFETLLKRDKRLAKTITSLGQLKHVILTNTTRAVTDRKLKALGLKQDLFDEILVTHEAPYLKPEPKLFSWAAKKMGVKPEQILAVGDREQTDILPAKKVGMRTAYVWGKSREADVSFATVYEVAELFGKEV
ncbi:MAG: HAD-IA family hydrolase [Candidatus Chisholmbacteria bacterium]|nr:HAD-IA family hydrolase [Candidatus Chisholmbacteria bacterium]